MKTYKHVSAVFFLFLAIAAVLPGCVSTPGRPGVQIPATEESATKALEKGEFLLAAQEFERLAKELGGDKRTDYELRSIDALVKAGQTQEARKKLSELPGRGLKPEFLARRQTLWALIASQEGDHVKAIRLLNRTAKIRNLDASIYSEIYRIKAASEQTLGNPIPAVKNLIRREKYLVETFKIDENQLHIWEILAALPLSELKQQEIIARDATLGGWLKLAIIYAENPGRFNKLAKDWKKDNPSHPLTQSMLDTLGSPAQRFIGRVNNIALLLPLTSKYAKHAEAVRDGFVAMHTLDRRRDKPGIKIYDIGDDPKLAKKFYSLAVEEGADLIVGPLGKESVDMLARKADLVMPTILLSHTDLNSGAFTGAVFQFGLTPEQEAMQAAERAYLDGNRQAVVLYPESSWGERMYTAFADHWQRLGGIILAGQTYQNEQKDFSEPVKQSLNVAQSEARKEALEMLIKLNLHFTPRKRQDADAIFLVADTRRGRLLKPHLNYFDPFRDLPVYSTSHIYAGKPNPVYDRDLDGIMFGDMPWMLVEDGEIAALRQNLNTRPYASNQLDRLYALGMDSYVIIPHLNQISAQGAIRFNGVTSGLSIDQYGRIQRQLIWAKFRGGAPRLLDNYFGLTGQFGLRDENSLYRMAFGSGS